VSVVQLTRVREMLIYHVRMYSAALWENPTVSANIVSVSYESGSGIQS